MIEIYIINLTKCLRQVYDTFLKKCNYLTKYIFVWPNQQPFFNGGERFLSKTGGSVYEVL